MADATGYIFKPVEPTPHFLDDCGETEYSVACCFAIMFKDYFRYLGKGKWEYNQQFVATRKNEGAIDQDVWVEDTQCRMIRKHLRTNFSSALTERGKAWQQYLERMLMRNNNATTHCHDAMFRIQRFLKVSNKLQNDVFLRHVIKEAASHFCELV